jgi:hypothetical protein
VSTWVITAGVRLHGRTRASPDAIQATPIATMASTTMNPMAFEVVESLPDAESITLSTMATHRPTASTACAAAATRSIGGVVPWAPSAERIPIVSHPFGHR